MTALLRTPNWPRYHILDETEQAFRVKPAGGTVEITIQKSTMPRERQDYVRAMSEGGGVQKFAAGAPVAAAPSHVEGEPAGASPEGIPQVWHFDPDAKSWRVVSAIAPGGATQNGGSQSAIADVTPDVAEKLDLYHKMGGPQAGQIGASGKRDPGAGNRTLPVIWPGMTPDQMQAAEAKKGSTPSAEHTVPSGMTPDQQAAANEAAGGPRVPRSVSVTQSANAPATAPTGDKPEPMPELPEPASRIHHGPGWYAVNAVADPALVAQVNDHNRRADEADAIANKQYERNLAAWRDRNDPDRIRQIQAAAAVKDPARPKNDQVAESTPETGELPAQPGRLGMMGLNAPEELSSHTDPDAQEKTEPADFSEARGLREDAPHDEPVAPAKLPDGASSDLPDGVALIAKGGEIRIPRPAGLPRYSLHVQGPHMRLDFGTHQRLVPRSGMHPSVDKLYRAMADNVHEEKPVDLTPKKLAEGTGRLPGMEPIPQKKAKGGSITVHEKRPDHFVVSFGAGKPFKIARKSLSHARIQQFECGGSVQKFADKGEVSEEPFPADPENQGQRIVRMAREAVAARKALEQARATPPDPDLPLESGPLSDPAAEDVPEEGFHLRRDLNNRGRAIAGGGDVTEHELRRGEFVWPSGPSDGYPAYDPDDPTANRIGPVDTSPANATPDAAAPTETEGKPTEPPLAEHFASVGPRDASQSPAYPYAQQPATQGAVPSAPAQPSTAASAGGGFNGGRYERELNSANTAAQRAELDKATAEKAALKAQEAMLAGQQAERAQYDANVQGFLDGRAKETQRQMDMINNRVVDPNRYWHSLGPASQAIMALAQAGSTFSAAFNHTPNYVMDQINTAINHDIDAQRDDIGKKNSLLATYMKQTGDLTSAKQMVRATMMDTQARQLEILAAKNQGAMVDPKTAATIAGMRAQSVKDNLDAAHRVATIAQARQATSEAAALAPFRHRLMAAQADLAESHADKFRADAAKSAQNQAQAGAILRGPPNSPYGGHFLSDDLAAEAPEIKGKPRVQLPDGSWAYSKGTKEMTDYNKSQAYVDQLRSIIDRIQKYRDEHNKNDFVGAPAFNPFGESWAEANALAADAKPVLNHANDIQRLSGVDIKDILKPQVPDPGDWNQTRSIKLQQELEKTADQIERSNIMNKTFAKPRPEAWDHSKSAAGTTRNR